METDGCASLKQAKRKLENHRYRKCTVKSKTRRKLASKHSPISPPAKVAVEAVAQVAAEAVATDATAGATAKPLAPAIALMSSTSTTGQAAPNDTVAAVVTRGLVALDTKMPPGWIVATRQAAVQISKRKANVKRLSPGVEQTTLNTTDNGACDVVDQKWLKKRNAPMHEALFNNQVTCAAALLQLVHHVCQECAKIVCYMLLFLHHDSRLYCDVVTRLPSSKSSCSAIGK
jgi:hypothetical protein